jgi:hypothetical protein
MKILQPMLFGAILVGAGQAHALIDDGKFGNPGELFVSVYDAAGQQSYYRDLGVNLASFLKNPNAVSSNLGQDPNFAPFLGKGLVYNVAAVYPLAKDLSNLGAWGYLATSSQGASAFNAAFNLIDNAQQKIQAYIGALNVLPFEGKPGQADENKSGVFGPKDLGYHGAATWGPSMGQGVGGNTEGKPDQPLDFYFVTNATGDDAGKSIVRVGAWTLSASGQLSFSGTPVSSNTPPVAVAGADRSVSVGVPVTLDGSASKDPDNGPSPLSYAWTQVSGPAVSLGGADAAKASFTPPSAGVYNFKLSVSDGAASSDSQVKITAEGGQTGATSIHLTAPAVWKVKETQTISFATSDDIGGKRPVKLQFIPDGGKAKTIKTVPNSAGGYAWKPSKAHVAAHAVIKACTSVANKSPQVCDQVDIVVQP